jgi:tetratricopeptide (TPR) repeat protein
VYDVTTIAKNKEPVPENQGVLASWKGIADYFSCDVRTAKRWEQERDLPVRRAPGNKRGTVFAYPFELDAWLESNGKSQRSNPTILINEEPPDSVHAPQDSPLLQAAKPSAQLTVGATQVKRFLVGHRQALIYLVIALVIAFAMLFRFTEARRRVAANSQADHALLNTQRHIPAPGAEELYLRGRYFWNLRTADSLQKAIDAYTQAILRDPSYAEAYAGLAESYDLLPQFGQADLGASLTEATLAADRALTLNPNLASAHTAKAFAIFFWEWDISGSDAEFNRALELDPNSAQAHQWYASTLQCRDDGIGAIKQIDQALRLNPASAAIAADAAYLHADFEDFEAGVNALKEIERTQPNLSAPAQFLRELAFRSGDYAGYVEQSRIYASITRAPDDVAMANAIAKGWASAGRIGLLEARTRILKASFARGSEQGFGLGETLLMLGRPQQALRYFRTSFERHSIQLTTMQDCPWAKPLLSDPGYAALLAQVRARLHGNYPAHPSIVRVSIRLPQ